MNGCYSINIINPCIVLIYSQAFSTNGMNTVTALNPLYAQNSLQDHHLTFYDGRAANAEYCKDSGMPINITVLVSNIVCHGSLFYCYLCFHN